MRITFCVYPSNLPSLWRARFTRRTIIPDTNGALLTRGDTELLRQLNVRAKDELLEVCLGRVVNCTSFYELHCILLHQLSVHA